MGSWDELCLVCGICPSGGPGALLHRNDLDNLAEQIVEEVKHSIAGIPDDELLSIVKNALASSFSDNDRKLDYRPTWLPVGLGQHADLTESACIAIGYFYEEEEGRAPLREGKFPDGQNVDLRRVRGFVSGDFRIVLRIVVRSVDEEEGDEGDDEDDEDDDRVEQVEDYRDSACCARTPEIPNFWLCQRCYHCLNAWLDVESLPARSDAMSRAGELYEIVNSRAQRRAETGLLPWINYDGIEATLQQSQIFFAPARLNSQNMAKGICAGLRGADLIPDIMRDFRCWIFMQPDIWPEPSTSPGLTFATYDSTPMRPIPAIATLPVELLMLIAHELPVRALLALSSTCKYLRALITDSSFLSQALSDALLNGNLRYILPITPGEISKADGVAEQWLGKAGSTSPDGDVMNIAMPFAHPNFPYAEFIRVCFESDSMRNRERIWGLVQQFRHSWKKYRTEGWEVDRFYPSEDLPTSIL